MSNPRVKVPPANGEVTIGGIVTALRLIKTKKGDRMASFVLEDLEGSVETLVFPEAYKKAGPRLADDSVVLVKARAEIQDDGKARLLASDVLPLEQAKLAEARHVTIRVPLGTWDRGKGERLRDILGWQIGDGSEEIMKLLIARSRFGRDVFDAAPRHAAGESTPKRS